MLTNKEVEYDLYNIYDNLLRGVMVTLYLSYDLDDIAENGVTEDNLLLTDVVCDDDALRDDPFDIPRIKNEVIEHLTYGGNREVLIQFFAEEVLTDSEFDLVAEKLMY